MSLTPVCRRESARARAMLLTHRPAQGWYPKAEKPYNCQTLSLVSQPHIRMERLGLLA
jgi:hypothetical protein